MRLSWAQRLKRVFEIDMAHCPHCGGALKIIAAILEQPVIEKILTHLGSQARAPPRAGLRGPRDKLKGWDEDMRALALASTISAALPR